MTIYNPQYSAGGDLGGDPTTDLVAILFMALLVAVVAAIIVYRRSSRAKKHER